jgi:D-2-hydroxyacid dehydrogenase (NADP+)
MHEVHIVVLNPVGEACLRQIAAVSGDLRVHDASNMFVFSDGAVTERPDPATGQELDALLSEAEIVYGFIPPHDLLARAPRLKWINAPSAGVDRFRTSGIAESPVMLTNSRGIHPVQMGETVFGMILMLAKKALFFFHMKEERKWQRAMPEVLFSKTLAVLGLGVIGLEVARLGKAFGMKVIALEARSMERTENVDALYGPERLNEVLSACDYAVITLPLTPETEKMIGEPELRAMKRTAYLVNVARGGIIDEDALVRALTEGWIAGAGLDVFSKEPLPPESRLWGLPNVIISPHVAGDRADYQKLAVNMFCDNLARYLAGQELFNLVDKKKGY